MPPLCQLTEHYESQYITYKFDKILQHSGRTVFRLLSYHPDLNPIDLIWATPRNKVQDM